MTFTADVCSSDFVSTVNWKSVPLVCGDIQFTSGFGTNAYGDVVTLTMGLTNSKGTTITGATVTVTSGYYNFWSNSTSAYQDDNAFTGPTLKTVTLPDTGNGVYSLPTSYDIRYHFNDLPGNTYNRQDSLAISVTGGSQSGLSCSFTKVVHWTSGS